MRLCVARPDGTLDVRHDLRPLARSGHRLVPLRRADVIPLPEAATIAHLPGRRAAGLDAAGHAIELGDQWLPAAAILPVGHLRTLLPASVPQPGADRLPLFGYTAVAEHEGELVVAALATDSFDWWQPARHAQADLPDAVSRATQALPGNRLVPHLARCALEYRCYTAQNTFHRRYEGALPASPACNADCLGCISLQSDGAVASPQERMDFAPTAGELAELAAYHLGGDDAAIVSFGQGCEGEALTRGRALVDATRQIREGHPHATVHVNTNGSRPRVVEQLIEAGCNSLRISAISFTDSVFRAYYRPIGYGLEEVITCGRLMHAAGGQVCLNLLTFPGVTDSPEELGRTVDACLAMGVDQIQWRSLNVDHDWLLGELPAMGEGVGLAEALAQARRELPGVAHGNFTRPVAAVPAR